MSYEVRQRQYDEAALATSEKELVEILKYCEVTIDSYACREYLFNAVVKAVDIGNLETAKKLAIIHTQTGYYSRHKIDYENIPSAQTTFYWVSFIESFGRSSCIKMGRALSKQHLIRLVDFVKKPIYMFNYMLSAVDDPDQMPETTYKIMTDPALNRSDRLNMLRLMKEHRKLTLQPCGPENLAPHFYCLYLRRQYLLKIFTDIPGLAQARGPNGQNFLSYASEKHPYLKYVRLFTKDELKSMLVEKLSDQYVLDLLASFQGSYLASDFLTAFKELLMEGQLKDSKEVDAPKLTNPRFIYLYSGTIGSNSVYETALKDYNGTREEKLECSGKTSFTFEELPLEILQLICEELNSRAFIALLLTSKSLQKFSERFGARYFERRMKKEFPMVYEFKSTLDQSQAVNWKHQLNLHSRRAHGWRTCKYPKQIRIGMGQHYTSKSQKIISFDDHWLIIQPYLNQQTLLWNVKEQKSYFKTHKTYSTYRAEVLDSPELAFPTIVSTSSSRTCIIDYNKSSVIVEIPKGWDSYYVAPVSRSRFIAGRVPALYDIELCQIVAQNNDVTQVQAAAHNKVTQMTAMSSVVGSGGQYTTTTCVLDKNFEITHSVQQDKSLYCNVITWLDEFRFSLRGYGLKIADIRMPRDFVHETHLKNHKPISEDYNLLSYCGNFTSNHLLKVSNSYVKLADVWSMQDFTWSNVVVLPDDVKDEPKCNSRYAAFVTKNNDICLLDFDTSK